MLVHSKKSVGLRKDKSTEDHVSRVAYIASIVCHWYDEVQTRRKKDTADYNLQNQDDLRFLVPYRWVSYAVILNLHHLQIQSVVFNYRVYEGPTYSHAQYPYQVNLERMITRDLNSYSLSNKKVSVSPDVLFCKEQPAIKTT